jgi:sn-glycerol 3-phosphate transport system ATP-binding protein
MSRVSLETVTCAWGDTKGVDAVSLSIEPGSFVVLLGPSGCGKSTTLRLIAGLERAREGRVLIDGRDVTGAPPSARGVSMVFQSYALFPHLTVAENILFGLKVRRIARPERDRRLVWAAELTGLADLLQRKPAQLSGGQRQRVALARAIVSQNPICLMDEPLSNLDAKLRQSMRAELRDLQRRLGLTVVYVTHDQVEAMAMADRVFLMNEGRIEQEGGPEDLYSRPATPFVARFVGTPPMNLIALEAVDGTAMLPDGVAVSGLAGPNGPWLLGVRPEDLTIDPDVGVPAVVEASEYHGADTFVAVRCGEAVVQIRLPRLTRMLPGERVRVRWAAEAMHLFDGTQQCRVEAPVRLTWARRSARAGGHDAAAGLGSRISPRPGNPNA